jgi:hypothetical protein
MKSLVEELLGPNADKRSVDYCAMSILAQCLHPSLSERRRIEGKGPRPLDDEEASKPLNVEEISSHVYEFSIAALETLSGRRAAAR